MVGFYQQMCLLWSFICWAFFSPWNKLVNLYSYNSVEKGNQRTLNLFVVFVNVWYWAKTKDPHIHQHCTFSCSICILSKILRLFQALQPQSSVGKNITSIILTNIILAKQLEHHFLSDATFCFSSHFEIKLLCCDNICQW